MESGFDDASERVPITWPPQPDDDVDGVDCAALLDLLTIGATSAGQIGRRVLFLAYVVKPPHQRGTLADLGRRLGVSRQRAHVMLTRFRRELPIIAREAGFADDELPLI